VSTGAAVMRTEGADQAHHLLGGSRTGSPRGVPGNG
jgi:hypothetical protein